MLAKKKPSKQKNIVMIIILIVCLGAMAYMLLGQSPVTYDEADGDDLLTPGFMQVRQARKIDEILKSLDMSFLEYDIYKRMKGGVSLPVVEDSDIGNSTPFLIKEFIPESF